MQKTNNLFKTIVVVAIISMSLSNANAIPFVYTPSSVTPVSGAIPDNGCFANGVTVSFNVADNFTVNDVDFGANITHPFRGALNLRLSSPTTFNVDLWVEINDASTNLNVLFDSDSGVVINGNHATAPDFVNVNQPATANALDIFNGEFANGIWTFFVCDPDGFNDNGVLTNSELRFDGTPSLGSHSITKSIPVNNDIDGNGYISVSDTLTYTVTATNTGSIALTNVVVSDPLLTPNSFTCANLAVGNTCVLNGTYTVLAVDKLAGNILNTATVVSDQTTIQNSNTVHTVVGSAAVADAESVFFMPLRESAALTAFLSIFPGPNVNTGIETCPNAPAPANPISTFSSITVLRTNTLIYYDHQEDGYESAPNASAQATTQVWGDGDITNGASPGAGCLVDACDVLQAGTIIVLDNQINTAGPDIIDFDGGDKISATDTISMTKANWASGSNTLFAGAFELYPTEEWGSNYEIPVGEDIAAVNIVDAKYQYVGLTVLAERDGTTGTIDLDGNPLTLGDIIPFSLDEGESQYVDGGILVGATISSNLDVQVNVITGDICASYESRFMTIFPTSLWDNSYYNPVGTQAADNAPVRTIIYNPNNTVLTVLVQDTTGSTLVSVPANSHFDYLQNSGTGARYCTTTDNTTCNIENGDVFYAISAIDADLDDNATNPQASQSEDWGFTLVPKTSLSQQALIGLGFGQDPVLPVTENSSPVWVTADLVSGIPINGIQLCVDYDNDGTDSGPVLTDPVTGQDYDITFAVNPFESTRLFDPDGDQTSMLIWVCDPDITDAGNAVIAVAWGQDPSVSSPGAPAIDLGTGVPNVSSIILLKEGALTNDINMDGFPSIGDTITYSISLTNVGFVPVDGEVLTDTLPSNVSYVINSTSFFNGVTTSPIADAGVTPFPLDEAGVALPGLVSVGNSFLVTFDVTIVTLPLIETEVCNNADITIPFEFVTDEFCIDLEPRVSSIGDFVWNDLNRDGIQDIGELGIEGVTVTLLDDTGTPVLNGIGNIITTTTAADGSWSFNLLAAGDYQVLFDASTATDGISYAPTAQNSGANDAIDSDSAPNGTSGQSQTSTFTLAEGETNNDIDSGFYQDLSVIGNRVWLDLDNDGIQDANEDGIANIIVSLTPPAGIDLGNGDGVAITTVTDSEGNYLFTDIPQATGYIVTVTNPPAGLTQTFDEDDPTGPGSGANTLHSTVVNITIPNEEYLTADFGYNAPSGSIGDFIWSDANGDGQQNPNEIGLPNVTVYLCTVANSNPCNGLSVGVVTVTTDNTGHYLFTGVVLTDIHVIQVDTTTLPVGYTLTGDPDNVDDDQTTVLPLNTSDNINLDADFGYQPPVASHFDIGDTLYQDTNGDGVEGSSEPGIPGITVQLFVDTTGNGIPDTPIATDITDNNGQYLFPSLPNGTAYSVLVTDTNNVLNDFIQTGDPDGIIDNQSTINPLNATDLTLDFGYRPIRSGTGAIGDRIFNDVDGLGTQNAGDQGFEGVKVSLFSSGGDFIGTTTTDENGNYLFTGLDITATYTVVVDTTTLPNGGVGWTNNIDPNGGNDSTSSVDLSLGTGINLDQDFGYMAAIGNTIEGTVWRDDDGSGELTNGSGATPDETPNGIDNVTVVLTDSNNNIVATTTTDVNGDYSFEGLADGTYTVIVTDNANELASLQHTDGVNAGDNLVDNNSQNDTGYAVAVSGGETNITSDFGYKPIVTTPITLASFEAVYNKQTGETTIGWSTLTETGNIGFEIFHQVGNIWEVVNDEIIASKTIYSTTRKTYEYVYFGEFIQNWAIVDIDIKGKRQSHGIYNINQYYGTEEKAQVLKSTKWNIIKQQHYDKEEERNQQKAIDINDYIKSKNNKTFKSNGEDS